MSARPEYSGQNRAAVATTVAIAAVSLTAIALIAQQHSATAGGSAQYAAASSEARPSESISLDAALERYGPSLQLLTQRSDSDRLPPRNDLTSLGPGGIFAESLQMVHEEGRSQYWVGLARTGWICMIGVVDAFGEHPVAGSACSPEEGWFKHGVAVRVTGHEEDLGARAEAYVVPDGHDLAAAIAAGAPLRQVSANVAVRADRDGTEVSSEQEPRIVEVPSKGGDPIEIVLLTNDGDRM